MKNKARQSCLVQIVLGLIKSRKVQFHAIAQAIKTEGEKLQVKSIIHRLEDFFREVSFDYDAIALLLLLCLGNKGKVRFCIDRTEWNFGSFQINILMIIACKGSKVVPLYWELLDNKSGNSNGQDRIDLVEKLLKIIDKERIGIIIGDREFIGHRWIKYLKDNKINFCFRVPKHHYVEHFDGERYKIEERAASTALCIRECLVDGVWVNAYIKKIERDDYLFLISNIEKVECLDQIYRRRWTIETVFQSFKSRGFNIEQTHIRDLNRVKKLIGLVSISFAFCIIAGIIHHQKTQKIKVKKHGYKATSFFRLGLDLLTDWLRESVEGFQEKTERFLLYLLFLKRSYDHFRAKRLIINT